MTPTRILIRIPALLAILFACMLQASATATAADEPELGVVAIKQPRAADFDRMGTANLDVYRMNLYWAVVQHYSADYFDWNGTQGAKYDDMVCNAARNGIEILPTVFGSPSWANGGKSPERPPTVQHRDEFGDFIAAAAARYGPGGSIWTEPDSPCSGLTPVPIVKWQIWNEPNLEYFWSPKPNAAGYKAMLVAAHRALEPSGGQVMLAGLSPRPQPMFGIWPTEFLRDLYRSGARPFFDLMSAHPYDLKPSGVANQVRALRKVMRSYGDRGKSLWVTEVGWATGGPKSTLTVKPGLQAAYLAGTYQVAKKEAGLGIEGLIWYSLRDVPFREASPPGRRDGWIYHSGLFTSKGVAKPAWKTLAKLAGGSPF